jgi:hypothetical protein
MCFREFAACSNFESTNKGKYLLKTKNKTNTIMKKLTIIAALAFTSFFFASCESSEIAPAQTAEKPATGEYQEPEFRNTTRNINTETPTINEVVTEIPVAIKPANVVAE